jgi:NitT/TauT family transport system ATP-binding protein
LLSIKTLRKEYRQNNKESVLALRQIDFQVEEGEFVSIVGPSGCGKTTLLLCMAGLMTPSSGQLFLNGGEVKDPPKEMVMIFQNYTNSLFPWKTVLGNILFAVENKDLPRAKKVQIAEKYLANVGLTDFINHYPWQLSGGMQQRVAIARGLAYGSEIILMDEPFASVDAQTREELEDLLLTVWERYAKTILFVTHDIDEAVYLSDRVIVLSKRPAVVLDTIAVDLARPRNQLETKGDERFIVLRKKIHGLIRS